MASATARLQGEIIKFIRQRHFESGERLFSEREFAEKFDTTRAAIREAFTALEALRVVERRPQSGIFLRDLGADSSIDALVLEVQNGILPSAKDIEDATEVRLLLEVASARFAATRRSSDDLEEIRRILANSEERIRQGQPINDEDELFHKSVAASTGNSMLLRMLNWFYELSRQRRVRYFAELKRSKASHRQHLKIFDALERGDPDDSAQAMESHLSSTSRHWKTILADWPQD